MSELLPIIIIIFWVIFVTGIVKGGKAQKRRNFSGSGNVSPKPAEFIPPKRPPMPKRLTPKAAAAPAKRYGSVSLKDSSDNMFLEDRNNDWLAKQMKEERKILSRSDMLDLGAAHEKSCQADALKKFHLAEHDDRIDTAESK